MTSFNETYLNGFEDMRVMVVDIPSVLLQWQSVSYYLLPFLLIFAVVFGILSATHILGGNKVIHIILAFVIWLMALELQFVPEFFREIFPRLGVGLAVLVALLILIGLFITTEDMKKWGGYVLMGVAVVIFIIILAKSFAPYGFYTSAYGDYAGWIIGAVLIIGLIIAVATSGSSNPTTTPGTYSRFREH